MFGNHLDVFREQSFRQKLRDFEAEIILLVDIDEIKHRLNNFMTDTHQIAGLILQKGDDVFRARVVTDEDANATLSNEFHELHWPKDVSRRKQSRCVRAGDAGLYVASSRNTAMMETEMTSGALLMVTRWQIMNDFPLNTIGFHPTVMGLLESPRTLASYLPEGANSFPIESRIYNEWLGRQFIAKGGSNLTVAIAEMHMGGVGAICYPTVARRGISDNILLSPQVARKNLRCKWIQFYRIGTFHENGNIDFDFVDFAVGPEWGKPFEREGRIGHWEFTKPGYSAEARSDGEIWRMFNKKTGLEIDMH